MTKFKNPDRWKCATSDGDHEKIVKAKNASDKSQESRPGRGTVHMSAKDLAAKRDAARKAAREEKQRRKNEGR
jgi:hypothetical protein